MLIQSYLYQLSSESNTGRPPLVYGFNGIPFIVLIRTLYGKLLKRSPCARGHTYTDRRALTVFLYGEKMNRDSSDSNERESVRPQPKRRRRETIFCSHCDRLVFSSIALSGVLQPSIQRWNRGLPPQSKLESTSDPSDSASQTTLLVSI